MLRLQSLTSPGPRQTYPFHQLSSQSILSSECLIRFLESLVGLSSLELLLNRHSRDSTESQEDQDEHQDNTSWKHVCDLKKNWKVNFFKNYQPANGVLYVFVNASNRRMRKEKKKPLGRKSGEVGSFLNLPRRSANYVGPVRAGDLQMEHCRHDKTSLNHSIILQNHWLQLGNNVPSKPRIWRVPGFYGRCAAYARLLCSRTDWAGAMLKKVTGDRETCTRLQLSAQ